MIIKYKNLRWEFSFLLPNGVMFRIGYESGLNTIFFVVKLKIRKKDFFYKKNFKNIKFLFVIKYFQSILKVGWRSIM